MKLIKINDKTYPASFNMAALLEFEAYTGMNMSELFENISTVAPAYWLKMQYLTLKFGSDEAGKRFTMTYSEFAELAAFNAELQESISAVINEDFTALAEIINQRTQLRGGEATTEEKK